MKKGNYLQCKQNTMQQKEYPELNATHGNTYNSSILTHRRLPQSFTQNPMKRKRVTSLSARRPLGDRPSSPPGVVTELVPRACTCRKPARSGGVEENGRCSVPSAQSRDRGLIVPAPGSPSFVVDGNRAQDAPTSGTEAHSRSEV